MTAGRRESGAGERGVVLVAVLLAVAIMSVTVVALAALTRAGAGSERVETLRLASHLALRSGLEVAKAMILALPPERRALFDGRPLAFDMGDGRAVTLTIRDVAGLADLNRSDPALLEGVAEASGVKAQAAKAFSSEIAEARRQAAQGVNAASTPKPVIFTSVEQLPLLDVLPEQTRQSLTPLLTVHNPTGRINPLAAPDEVLSSIPGITGRDIAAVLAARKSGAGQSDPRLRQLFQRLKGALAAGEPSVFTVSVTLGEAEGIIAGSTASAVIMMDPKGPLPFRTLAVAGQ